jgi:hypothetical protein
MTSLRATGRLGSLVTTCPGASASLYDPGVASIGAEQERLAMSSGSNATRRRSTSGDAVNA